jgi:ectoine hydroxylase-related dioxygenase (phytanoyl-CoA dioxygenase family)
MASDLEIGAANASTASVAERFDRDGVVVVTDFVDRETSRAAAGELDEIVRAEPDRPVAFANQGYADQRLTAVRNWPLGEVKDRIPNCRSILRDTRLGEWAAAICGPDYARLPGSIASTFPGCGQAWHQDSRDPAPAHFTLNRIFFVADVTPEQGRLRVVPGSHRAGDIPTAPPYGQIEGEVAITPPAGSVVLMHSRCFHQVERNESDRPRTQFNARVMPAKCPQDVTAFPLFSTGPWNFVTGRAE